MAMNVYTVVRVDNLGSFRVRRDVRDVCQPEIGDIVYRHHEPVGRITLVTEVGQDTFDVVMDRNAQILIASLLAIGVP
jgi:hypothetical protein